MYKIYLLVGFALQFFHYFCHYIFMKRIIPFVAICIFQMLFSTNTWCADLKKGATAYKDGDYAAALREWKPLAFQGNAKAQFFLGNMYYKGIGVSQDDGTAYKWFKKAAEQGLTRAQNNLGTLYMRGLGVSRNNTRAFIWLHITALQGDKVGIKNRDLVAKIMSENQIKKAEELALECKKKKYKGCY